MSTRSFSWNDRRQAMRRTSQSTARADKIFYGKFLAVRDSNVPIEKGKITVSSDPPAAARARCCAASTA